MTGTFISLIFGFCASISDNGSSILFGYQSSAECVVVLDLSGNNPKGQDLVVNSHNITWEWLEGGAEVAIDDQRFVILKFGLA